MLLLFGLGLSSTNTNNIKCHPLRARPFDFKLKSNPNEKVYIWNESNLAQTQEGFIITFTHTPNAFTHRIRKTFSRLPFFGILRAAPLQLSPRPSTRYAVEPFRPKSYMPLAHPHSHSDIHTHTRTHTHHTSVQRPNCMCANRLDFGA